MPPKIIGIKTIWKFFLHLHRILIIIYIIIYGRQLGRWAAIVSRVGWWKSIKTSRIPKASRAKQEHSLLFPGLIYRIYLERKMFLSFSLHDLHILCSYYMETLFPGQFQVQGLHKTDPVCGWLSSCPIHFLMARNIKRKCSPLPTDIRD